MFYITDLKVSIKEQINFFKELLTNKSLYIRCFSTKKLYKTLYQCFQVAATCRFLDPYTADWLLHGSISEKKWNEMVKFNFRKRKKERKKKCLRTNLE